VSVFDQDAPELKEAKTRGLPDDMTGKVRVISIGNLDKNMCCGTHLKNTSELQSINILYQEAFKGNTRIWFVAGERVRKTLGLINNVQRKVTTILGRNLMEHTTTIQDLQKSLTNFNRTVKTLSTDLGIAIGQKLLSEINQKNLKAISYHHNDVSPDFMTVVLKVLAGNDPLSKKSDMSYQFPYLVVLSIGDAQGGHIKICGPETMLDTVGVEIAQLFEVKGKNIKGTFQGKAASITPQKLSQLEKIINHLNQ